MFGFFMDCPSTVSFTSSFSRMYLRRVSGCHPRGLRYKPIQANTSKYVIHRFLLEKVDS